MFKTSRAVCIPFNRVEGDLEVRVEVEDGIVTEAWSTGTMYRGFETMMVGRGALDGLVITPRVCGICSITHLTAAVEALEKITGVSPPDNARRLRNIALMVETVQSDVRQALLMFMVDFTNTDAYREHPMLEEAVSRYGTLKGRAQIEVIRETKRLLQIVAIIGGQWPHTSFMVPGGVTSIPDSSKILQCKIIYERFHAWYERTILGCTLERWQNVQSARDLDLWLDESTAHRESELGFFIRFSRLAGLDRLGAGPGRYLSFGNLPLPAATALTGRGTKLISAGYGIGTEVHPFDQARITEDISHSWFEQKDEPLHPINGRTKPYASGQSGRLYSWIKAPRYDGEAVETGPLAEMIVEGSPLFTDLIERSGPNVFIRELARLVRPARFLPPLAVWLDELLKSRNDSFYHKVRTIPDGEGYGTIQAARGALGHWLKVKNGKIAHYQIITPSSWNGSPRDARGVRGAWEEALIGTPIKDIGNPVEAGHVIRSFDPCLVCAVHCLRNGHRQGTLRIGFCR